MNYKILCLLVAVLMLISCVSAATTAQKIDLKEGVTKHLTTEVNITGGKTTFKDTVSGLSVTTSTKIDGVEFKPGASTKKGTDLEWSNNDVTFTYEYTPQTLKETIVLKKDKVLSFPLTLDAGSSVKQDKRGDWIVTKPADMTTIPGAIILNPGIGILKPYGYDATGKYIPMSYSLDTKTQTFSLNYDRTGITYPLTIDPTVTTNITTTSTWTVPAGVTQVTGYQIWAGGGSGGGGVEHGGGGGGQASSVVNSTAWTVTPGATYSIVLGSGGSTAASGTSNAGGSSSAFGFTATGGAGGSFGYQDDGYWVGNGATGYITDTAVKAADGGSNHYGAGGIGGSGYGSGGGGGKMSWSGYAAGTGGAGYAGAVTISYADTPVLTGITETPHSGNIPFDVTFGVTNSGSAATSWNWSFGDGTYSASQNPTHSYTTAGSYQAQVYATNANGNSNTLTSATITANPHVVEAAFSATPLTGIPGTTVSFTDATTYSPTAWNWSFGDGSYSEVQNPSHQYTSTSNDPQLFTITLITASATSTDTETKTGYINITPVLTAFTGTPLSGPGPLTVQFYETSTNYNPTTWSWNFGDGFGSNSQNPSHTFETGDYTVTLQASDAYSSNTTTKIDYIHSAIPAPVAAFSSNKTSGIAPVAVLFTDASTGSPNQWNWSFGDGTLSTVQNPSHSYTNPGKYTVTLIASSAYGNSTILSRTDYITAIYRPTSSKYVISGIVTDKVTGYVVSDATVTLSNVTSSWTNTSVSTAEGLVYFVNIDDGSYSVTVNDLRYNIFTSSFTVAGADPATLAIELDSTSTVPSSIRYYPHMVRFICKDNMGKTLKNITVEATGFATSSDPAWIKELLGIDLNRVQMDDQLMTAQTGADGAVVFLMLEAVQYDITFVDVAQGVSDALTLYPSEATYQVTLSTTATGDIFSAGSSQIVRKLSHGQTSTDAIFRLAYYDPTLTTTNVTFWVTSANTTVYTHTYLGGDVNVSKNVTPYVHGTPYQYGFQAYNPTYGGADGYIYGTGVMTTRSRLITIPGLADFWYTWIVVILLILFVAMFSGITNKYSTLFFGIFVLFYWYIGWIDWFPNILDDQGLGFAMLIMILGTLVYTSRTYTAVGE